MTNGEALRRDAIQRAAKAKEKMDEANAALAAAEDEWHEACRDLDRIEAFLAGELSQEGK